MNKILLYVILLYGFTAGTAYGNNLGLGSHYYLDPNGLEVFALLEVEREPRRFDNNVLRIRGYVDKGKYGDALRLYPSMTTLKKFEAKEAIAIVPENRTVKDDLSKVTNTSCVLMAGIFNAYTKNFIGSGNAANNYGLFFVSGISPCGGAQRESGNRVSLVDLKTLKIRGKGNFKQLYFATDGTLVFATDGGCNYHGICRSYIVRGATIAVHLGGGFPEAGRNSGAIRARASVLAMSMPGAADVNLMGAYNTVLFVAPSGERYILKTVDGRRRAKYIGEGDKKWGDYVEQVWRPYHPKVWYVKKSVEFLRTESK